ncbi:MAG: sensor histidine kinase, partial [Bryobacteraceae bacterium]
MAMVLHQGERSAALAVDNSTPVDDSGSGRSMMARWLRLGWLLYFVLALLMGAYLGINQRIDNPGIAVWKPFVWEYSSALIIVALVPVVVGLERRFHVDARPRGRVIAVHLAGAIVFSAVHVTVIVALRKLAYALAGESYDFGNVPVRAFYELQKDAIIYVVIMLVAFAVREFRVRRAGELRAAQLVVDLSDARLRQLTAQIEPHFLFNTLNAISNRMREDVDAADRMISHLGDLLRAAYDTDHQVLVPLGSELGWLRGYAVMMVERFRGQFAFDLDVEPGLEAVEVPRLLLQPIVENAIRHGLGEGCGWLSVDVRRVGAHIR